MSETDRQLREIRSELRKLQRQLAQLTNVCRMQSGTMMSLDEAAIYTGYSKRQLYKLTSDGNLPCYRPTKRRVFVERDIVDEWIRGGLSKVEEK